MEQKRAIKEIMKMKKADNLSILNDRERSGNEERLVFKDSAVSAFKARNEKIKPHPDPIIEKKLLQKLASLSFFLKSNALIAPIIKKEIRAMKPFWDRMIFAIVIYLSLILLIQNR